MKTAGITNLVIYATWSWKQWKRHGGGHYAHAVREENGDIEDHLVCGIPIREGWEIGDEATPKTIHCARCKQRLAGYFEGKRGGGAT